MSIGHRAVVDFDFRLKGEKFYDTKKRLQGRLGLSDKEFVKYRFALIQVSTFKQPSYIEDGALLVIMLASLTNCGR